MAEYVQLEFSFNKEQISSDWSKQVADKLSRRINLHPNRVRRNVDSFVTFQEGKGACLPLQNDDVLHTLAAIQLGQLVAERWGERELKE